MNRPRRRLGSIRPILELLEDRTLLSKGVSPADIYLQSVGFAPASRPLEYLEPPPADFPIVREPAPISAASFTGLLPFSERESNNTPGTANQVPLGFDGGEDFEVDVTGSLAAPDLAGAAQNVDMAGWNTSFNNNITSSTLLPHISIQGTGDGSFDYYSFTVANSGDQAVFDIDAENFDTELFLYDTSGNLLDFNDDASGDNGDGGTGFASRLNFFFTNPGTYIIGVGAFFSFDAGGQIGGDVPLPGDTYTLHISLANHDTPGGSDPVTEVETNHPVPDLLGVAQNVDGAGWNLNDDPDGNIVSPTVLPHISIQATGDGTFDYYSFTVANAGDQGVFDIDFENGLDSELFLYDTNGNLLDTNDIGGGDPGSTSPFASFLTHTFAAAGTYIIGVGRYDSFTVSGEIAGNTLLPGDVYTLHISLENHTTNASGSDPVTEVETNHPAPSDVDYFAVDLQPGDIFGANLLDGGAHMTLYAPDGTYLLGSGQDITFIHPASSPLPGGGNAALSHVASTAGTYTIAVDQGGGDYTLQLRAYRPVLEDEPVGTSQIIYLDFNGAFVNPAIFGGPNTTRFLSPLRTFLPGWGLAPTFANRDAVIDAIVAGFERSFSTDIRANGNNGDYDATGNPGDFDVQILNSRDDPDPFGQPNVSRVIIGGTISQLGIGTIGISQSIDVGNFDTTETAVVLLDLLSAPTQPIGTAAQDVDMAGWNTNSNNNITNSTAVPHISIQGTGDGTFDYYSFTVANAGDQGVFDIDAENFDTELFLYDANGVLFAENDDAPTGDPGDGSIFASRITFTFPAAGTYVIGVGAYDSIDAGGQIFGSPPLTGDAYTLHISLENHATPSGSDPVTEMEPNNPISNPDSLNQYALASGTSIIDLIGTAVGNIAAHEAGHFSGNWHTNQFNAIPNIQDQGGNLANTVGVGPDHVFGTSDDIDVTFGVDYYVPNEGFAGNEDTRNSIAFGLSTGKFRPPNDDFVDRFTIDPAMPQASGNNGGATPETGEPDHAGSPADSSLWWTWTAPATATARITTRGSAFDTRLAVYTGSSVDNLTLVAQNDNVNFPTDLTSEVTFQATAGTVYQIAVDGVGGATGTVKLDIDLAPGAIAVVDDTVDENQPVGTLVGVFDTTDPDANDSFTYELVIGVGDTDNGAFQITGNRLETGEVFDREGQNTYSIRVRTTDRLGLSFEQELAITINNVNEPTTDLTLDNDTIAEDEPPGTRVGTFQPTDPDVGETFAYALVTGPGSNDNAAFRISGADLISAGSFNFESKKLYRIRVRVTDSGGFTVEKAFTIDVTNINEPPAGLALSDSFLPENEPAGTLVGVLRYTDPDIGDSVTFALVAGPGSDDNGRFALSGDQLLTTASFDFETQSTFSILIRATDSTGLSVERNFLITLRNVNEPPTDLTLDASAVAENQPPGTVVGNLGAIDPDGGEAFTFTLVDGPGATDNASFRIIGRRLEANRPFDFETEGTLSLRVQVTDRGGLSVVKVLTLNVLDVNEAPTDIFLTNNTILERLPAGSAVGDLGAVDQDPGEGFTFALVTGEGDTGNPSFVLDGTTLRTTGTLDFEATPTLTVRVRATDIVGNAFEKVLVVSVLDVNEAQTVGTFDPATGRWFLRSDNTPGYPDSGYFAFGAPNWRPVLGDWDGDDIDTIGVVDNTGFSDANMAVWYLRNTNSPGTPDIGPFRFGLNGWIPVVGDWDGDGITGIGMVDPGTGIWYLRNTPDAGPVDIAPFAFGLPGWIPVAGDWNGDGVSSVGTFDPSTGVWFQRNANGPGAPDIVPFAFGLPGWTPVVGDWEGNKTTTVGVVDGEGNWYLHIANTGGFPVVVRFTYGDGDWVPLAGTYSIPLLRTSEVGPNVGLPPLDPGVLGGVVTAALPRLAAEGIDPTTLDRIAAAQVVVANLPGTLLGQVDTANNRIWIDSDAAGWGWFVDQTPAEDSEFTSGGVEGMDLLSVVAHELGHLAGLGHSQNEGDLMSAVLEPGQRHLRTLDAVFTLGM